MELPGFVVRRSDLCHNIKYKTNPKGLSIVKAHIPAKLLDVKVRSSGQETP